MKVPSAAMVPMMTTILPIDPSRNTTNPKNPKGGESMSYDSYYEDDPDDRPEESWMD